MLLVVVDQARVRRRGDDAVEGLAVLNYARVVVQDARGRLVVADDVEELDATQRVERVAPQECRSRLHRPAHALVLVAPVLARLRLARRLEVEMRGATRRPCGTREHNA